VGDIRLRPDYVTAAFEIVSAFFIWLSIRAAVRSKLAAGVSWVHVGFYSFWGVWNLFYYPHLHQWAAFAGGILITGSNTIWTCLLVYYTLHPGGRRAAAGIEPKYDDPAGC
jgi:hypothetical protein